MTKTELPEWQRDAAELDEFHYCEAGRGREFILKLNTGTDPVLAVENFARKLNIKYGKIHAAFMGGFYPARYFMWARDTANPENWHHEEAAVNTNLSLLTSLSGLIAQRINDKGEQETFAAMHFVAGGAWDVPCIMGHLLEGTRVKGSMEFFITELLDIEVMPPVDISDGVFKVFPENFYRNTAGK